MIKAGDVDDVLLGIVLERLAKYPAQTRPPIRLVIEQAAAHTACEDLTNLEASGRLPRRG